MRGTHFIFASVDSEVHSVIIFQYFIFANVLRACEITQLVLHVTKCLIPNVFSRDSTLKLFLCSIPD